MHYSLAILIGTILGILFNFKTIGALVFREKNNSLIFRFIGVYGLVYLGNISGLRIFTYLGISNYIGGAAMLVPMGLLSYFLNKYFVFNKNLKKEVLINKDN